MKLFRRLAVFILAASVFLAPLAYAKSIVHVKGYTKKDGTYVAPHERSAPNKTKSDNWSTNGNVNPYTGKEGTKNVDEVAKDLGSASSASREGSGTSREGWKVPPSGKSKQEILAQYGEPNIKTAKRWIYSGKGEVQFTDKGVSQ